MNARAVARLLDRLRRPAGIALALLASLVGGAATPLLAGETFLGRNPKVHEAVPYGRSVEETASPTPVPPVRPPSADTTGREPPRDRGAIGAEAD